MSTAKKVQLPVKATLVMNFGKFDYVYKPLDEKGVSTLKMVIAMSGKDSKRQNFSKTDIKAAQKITSANGIELEFVAMEVNSPDSLPTPPVVGQPISFDTAPMPVKELDLGFLA